MSVSLALSNVKIVSVGLSISKPFTNALPGETIETNLVMSPGVDVFEERKTPLFVLLFKCSLNSILKGLTV